jgi:hypothetical protein
VATAPGRIGEAAASGRRRGGGTCTDGEVEAERIGASRALREVPPRPSRWGALAPGETRGQGRTPPYRELLNSGEIGPGSIFTQASSPGKRLGTRRGNSQPN